MNTNPLIDKIDFDAPDEDLVMRAIFWKAHPGEYRGFSDVFTCNQILRMGASEHVLKHWRSYNRSWLWQTASSQEPI